MLYNAAIIREVADFLKRRRRCDLVVDPVMVATSGALLLRPTAIRALIRDLLPQATLLTPNVPEAERLTGQRISEPEHLRSAARVLKGQFGCAVLVKGGHLGRTAEVVDLYYDGQNELLLTAPRVRGANTHGTGCTLAAAITARLAQGVQLPEAIVQAKSFLTEALTGQRRVGRHRVLNWFKAREDGESLGGR
jgi:hydroxymethylpyrimidine/phosphomethylpyrimidine kinase